MYLSNTIHCVFFSLCDSEIVIDGNNLIFYVMSSCKGLNCAYGGEYRKVYFFSFIFTTSFIFFFYIYSMHVKRKRGVFRKHNIMSYWFIVLWMKTFYVHDQIFYLMFSNISLLKLMLFFSYICTSRISFKLFLILAFLQFFFLMVEMKK